MSTLFLAALPLSVFPWLDPITFGPTATAVPWLASAACAVALWMLAVAAGAQRPRGLPAAASALVLWAWLGDPVIHQELVFLAGGLGVIVLAAWAVGNAHVGRGVQVGLLVAAGVSAMFGLCQYFAASAAFQPWISYAQAGEAYANLRQPNQYATLCWLGMAVLLWGAPRLPGAVAVGIAVLLAVASAASVSRTGLFQGLVLTILAAAWPGPDRRMRLQLCAVAAIAYAAATVLLPFALQATTGALPARTLWGRIGGGESCSSRVVLWSNVLHLIVQRPWEGWGWGELDYAHFATLYPGERFCDILDNAHNVPLHLAVELGVPAAFLVCGGFLWWALLQRPWREADERRRLAWALLAVLLVHSLLEYPLWYGPFQIALGAALGWLVPRPPLLQAARPFGLALGAAPVLLVALAYAAWDYTRVSQVYLAPEQRQARWAQDSLGAARQSWLFASQGRFAELTLLSLTRENADWMRARAEEMLHYSPEPRVIERLIESASLSGRLDEAVLTLARYRAAFPTEYAQWKARQRGAPARP